MSRAALSSKAFAVRLLITATFCLMLALLMGYVQAAYASDCPSGGEHTFVWHVEQQPTEDADGVYEGVCSKCGYTVDETISATGHLWSDWTVDYAATCTSEGLEQRVCTRYPSNPHYEYRTIPMLSPTGQHDYKIVETVDATCEQPGRIVYVCSYCGDSYTEETPALGHVWGEWTTILEATADQPGRQQRVCERDASHVETRETPVLTQAEYAGSLGGGQSGSGGAGSSSSSGDAPTFGQPDVVDAIAATAGGFSLVVFGLLAYPLFVQLAWIRKRKRRVNDAISEKTSAGRTR